MNVFTSRLSRELKANVRHMQVPVARQEQSHMLYGTWCHVPAE